MTKLYAWFIYHRLAANLLLLLIIGAGLLSIHYSHKEILPNVQQSLFHIQINARNMQAAQAEQKLCLPLETALGELKHIEQIHSTASQGQCQIFIKPNQKYRKKLTLEIQQAINRTPLPPQASQPILKSHFDKLMAARLSVSGDVPYTQLQQAAEKIVAQLKLQGLQHVALRDNKNQRIIIEVSEKELFQHQLSLTQIADTLKIRQQSLSAGYLNNGNDSQPIIINKGIEQIDELGQQIIYSPNSENTQQLLLKDIASIQQQFDQPFLASSLNAKPAIFISVFQDHDKSITDIADIIHNFISHDSLPSNITVQSIQDNARFFIKRLEILKTNATIGLLLVLFSLWIFLRLRLAFWVCVGIPVALIGSFIISSSAGYSINMISSFALLLVLGIVVDDAIIVGESIYRHQKNASDSQHAALIGLEKVAKPVIFAAITTAISFSPLFFLPGAEGELMSQIPIMVIACLFFSLLECLLILPAHLSRLPEKNLGENRLQKTFQTMLEHGINHYYQPLLKQGLRFRYVVLCGFTAILALSISLILSGHVPVSLLSKAESEIITINLSYPKGTANKAITQANAIIEQATLKLQQQLLTQHGQQQIINTRSLLHNDGLSATYYLYLAQGEQRKVDGETTIKSLQRFIGDFPQAKQFSFNSLVQLDTKHDLAFILQSDDLQQLQYAGQQLSQFINQLSDDVYAYHDASKKNQISIQLKPLAYELGVPLHEIQKSIQQAFSAQWINRIQQSSGSSDIIIRLPENEQNSLWHLENLMISLPISHKQRTAQTIALQQLATIEKTPALEYIRRTNGHRTLTVYADINTPSISRHDVYLAAEAYFQQSILSHTPNVRLMKSLSQRIESDVQQRLAIGFLIAVILMFASMAILFSSYSQPLMVLTAIPFGIIGALIGHLLLGESLTLWSMAGIVAVSGIVVNDNIVLIHFINSRINQGMPMLKAILSAGKARFRPIILTTITSFLGLIPMLFEKSFEAQFLIPMAISISFGVLFATSISLFLVPSLYLIRDDLRS